MSEFEIHQLIVGSRYEFDFATLAYMGWALAFIIVSRIDDRRWSVAATWLMGSFYLVGAGLIALRCAAAVIRSMKQTGLLSQTAHQFDFANPSIQFPTLILRLLLGILAPVVVIYFLRRKSAS